MSRKLTTLIGVLMGCCLQHAAIADAPAVQLEPEYLALYYYKASGEPIDLAALAATSPKVANASAFDRPQFQKAEEERLRKGLDAVSGDRALMVNINTLISQYDFQAQEFAVEMFGPGRFIPMQAYGKPFRLVFENADELRAIKMPVDEARKFDATLGPGFHTVTARIVFNLTGAGDPTGVVESTNTVRAHVSKASLMRSNGTPIKELVVGGTPSPAPQVTAKQSSEWDVRGLRLGMKVENFQALAQTAFADGKLSLRDDQPCGGGGKLSSALPREGSVCVTYDADTSNAVRKFTVRQVLTPSNQNYEDARKALLAKYGPVAFTDREGFGWGEAVGGKAAKNYAVFASLSWVTTLQGFDSGNRGVPVMTITVTDSEYARTHTSQLQPTSAATPKL